MILYACVQHMHTYAYLELFGYIWMHWTFVCGLPIQRPGKSAFWLKHVVEQPSFRSLCGPPGVSAKIAAAQVKNSAAKIGTPGIG